MPIEAKSFMAFADQTIKNDDEFSIRCSVSRAYYGAFHIARIYLGLDEYTQHKEVIDGIKSDNFTLGSMLFNLHESRKRADYRISRDCDKERAFWHIEECKNFIKSIKKLEDKYNPKI